MTLRPFSSTLQGNYRDTFQTPGAPEVIDDDIPVLAVVPIQNNYDGVGSQQVRLNGLPFPATAGNFGVQTIVSKKVSAVATGTTIHTVTAGKTFYCMGATISLATGASAGFTVGGTQVSDTILAANGNFAMFGGVLFVATSGQTIVLTHGTGAANGYATIWGFEQ